MTKSVASDGISIYQLGGSIGLALACLTSGPGFDSHLNDNINEVQVHTAFHYHPHIFHI